MTLHQAWQAVQDAGLPLRYVREGETVGMIWRGQDNEIIKTPQAIVVNNGCKYDNGRCVNVRYISGPKQGQKSTYPLEDLLLD